MSRSKRKTSKTPESRKREAATGTDSAQASAAFATAHRFAAAPPAADAGSGKSAAKPKPATTGRGKRAAAAAETAERVEAAEAKRSEPTESPEPAPAAPEDTGRTSAEAARETAPATPGEPDESTLAETAGADERPGPGVDPYAGTATAHAPASDEPAGAPYAAAPGAAQREDLPPEHAEPEGERTSFATIALMTLAGIIVVAALTLWLAPKVAPYVPAPVARFLAPGQLEVEDRIAEIEARIGDERAAFEEGRTAFDEERASLAAEIEDLQEQVGDLAAQVGEAGPGDETRAQIEAAAGERAAITERLAAFETAAGERAALARRIAELDTAIGNMRSEIAAMNEALAEAESGEGPTNPELAAALAQLQSRVESLAADMQTARAGIDEQVAGLADRLDERIAELSARVDQALERTQTAEAARAEAEAEASRTAAAAALREALAELETRFARGKPYAEALAEVEQATDTPAPDPLAAGAEAGLPTATRLAEDLSRVAPAALASARADAPDNPLEGIANWARSQVGGRPTVETPGTGVGAILSRVEARLEEEDVPAALAAAEALPRAAREAIQSWLERLRARAAAEQALAEWRAGLSAAG